MCSPWGWGLYTIVELPSGIVGLHAARAWRARPPPSRLIKGSSRAHQGLLNGSSRAPQRLLNGSSTAHQGLVKGSSTARQRLINGSSRGVRRGRIGFHPPTEPVAGWRAPTASA